MEQFKQYGIISLLGIAFFTGIYSSIQLFDWLFFPWLQVGVLSILTCIMALIQFMNRQRNFENFIWISWLFIVLEWGICLLLFNQPKLLMEKVHMIFLPLLYYLYIALYQLVLTRNQQTQKRARMIFYFLVISTLTFFFFPSPWSAAGVEILFLIFLGLILFSKAISPEQ